MHSPSLLPSIAIRLETPADEPAIEILGKNTFGPGRFARAAFRLREGVASDPKLSFVAEINGRIGGSVKLTHVVIGDKRALVLGPLMIDPAYRNMGIGRELMNRSILEARLLGHRYIVLVGDFAYYGPFGFDRIEPGKIRFPGPADPARILGCELVKGVGEGHSGIVRRYYEMQ